MQLYTETHTVTVVGRNDTIQNLIVATDCGTIMGNLVTLKIDPKQISWIDQSLLNQLGKALIKGT